MVRNRHSMEETVGRVRSKIPTVYDLDLEELIRLCELSMDSLGESLCIAFDYGYAKGTQAKASRWVSAL